MDEKELFGKLFVIAIASGAGGAFLLIKFGGKKWIENIFSKNFEAFKAQKLHEFDLLLTRKTRWHEKEHEVLSTLWIKLMDAYNALKRSIGMLRESPDLDGMVEQDFSGFLEGNDFSDSERKFLKSEENKNRAYSRILDFRDLNQANKLFLEFHSYFENNRIFLSPDIKDKFAKVDDYIWSAWVDRKIGMDDRKISFTIDANKTRKEDIEPLMNEIDILIQKKLFPNESKR